MIRVADHVTLLEPGDHRVMPWKNGGGTTREILSHPPASADFHWRVSIADVERDGNFSLFPGIARTIMLMRGKGMQLRIDDHPVILDSAFNPFDFPGEASTFCTLVDGPVRDLNIMSAHRHARHRVDVIREFPFRASEENHARMRVLHCLQGSLQIQIESLPGIRIGAEQTLVLEPHAVPFRCTANDPENALLIVDFFVTA